MSRRTRARLYPVHDLPDHGIRALLEDPDNLHDLLEEAAPELVPHLDFAHIRFVQRDFALEDWRERQNDVFLVIPYRELGRRPLLICILIEHLNSVDPAMPLRMFVYAVLYWEKRWKAWEKRKPRPRQLLLPTVLGVVFYTAAAPWNGPRSIEEMLDGPEALVEGSPHWQLRFVELRDRQPEEWVEDPRPWWTTMAVLRGERLGTARFRQVFGRALQRLQAVQPKDRVRWEELMRFAIALGQRRREAGEQEALREVALDSQEDAVRRRRVASMWNVIKGSWEEDVLKRGAVQGELKARRDDLEFLLADRFGPLPETLLAQLRQTNDPERLRAALRQVPRLHDLSEFRL